MTDRTARDHPDGDGGLDPSLPNSDRDLFRRAVGAVRPLAADRRAGPPVRRAITARPRERPPEDPGGEDHHGLDPQGSEAVSYRRAGIQIRVLRRLRRGSYPAEDRLDLHGLTSPEAGRRLVGFLDDCRARGIGCVLVIHGKGRGSPGSKPVLKASLMRWLRAREDVVAFCSARPADGGSGAVYVLLRRGGPR